MFELPWFIYNNKKTKSHKKVCKNKVFCGIIMPFVDIQILEFDQHQIYDKTDTIYYLSRSGIFG